AYKLYSSGKLKESLEEWQEVLVFDPGNSRAREYIEKIKDKLGEKEREKAEREMLLKRQARINTLINRGEKFLEKNRISEAIRKFEEVFKYEPENSKAAELIAGAKKQRNKLFDKYHSRALEHRSRKEYRKAIKYFRKALDFKDSSRVRAALKEVREKIKETTPQVSQAMVDKLYYTAADHYFNQRYEKAMSLINKILKFRPGDENTLKLKEKISATMELSNR
ncbi:MAG: hypothetical protein U9R36_00115, partial [Elusimicrobiota bacterium]|nr:hypothetical protein [Elusimicrobiota bacterium]